MTPAMPRWQWLPCCLGAVVPDWLLILDDDLEHVQALALGDYLEAGEECIGILRRARAPEARLRNRVVLGQVVLLNHVSDLGDDVLGIEDQLTPTAGYNRVGDTGMRCRLASGCHRRWEFHR